jgi:hypothetical protein
MRPGGGGPLRGLRRKWQHELRAVQFGAGQGDGGRMDGVTGGAAGQVAAGPFSGDAVVFVVAGLNGVFRLRGPAQADTRRQQQRHKHQEAERPRQHWHDSHGEEKPPQASVNGRAAKVNGTFASGSICLQKLAGPDIHVRSSVHCADDEGSGPLGPGWERTPA